MRIDAIGVFLVAAFGLLSPAVRADEPTLPEQIVDSLNHAYGVHPGFRANHAKGIVAEGVFTPAPGAAAISKASVFTGKPTPLTVRFSDSTGLPDLPDGHPYASPHGIALKFHLADGSEMDLVTNSLKFFPIGTGEDFRDLFEAIAASPPTAPHPNRLEQFLTAHPAVAAASMTVATPTSFATETYNGVDAFVFVDAAGKKQAFRWKIIPAAGTHHMTDADAAKQAPNFLRQELPERLAKAPVVFSLSAQLAAPGDPTSDATKPWPEDRKVVELGTISITNTVADSASAEKPLLFLPTNIPEGIELSDDPLPDIRTQAYAVSFGRRAQ